MRSNLYMRLLQKILLYAEVNNEGLTGRKGTVSAVYPIGSSRSSRQQLDTKPVALLVKQVSMNRKYKRQFCKKPGPETMEEECRARSCAETQY